MEETFQKKEEDHLLPKSRKDVNLDNVPDLEDLDSFTDEVLCLDGIFIIRVIADNLGELPAAYLSRGLYDSFRREKRKTTDTVEVNSSSASAYNNVAYMKSPNPGLWPGRLKGRGFYGSNEKGAKHV